MTLVAVDIGGTNVRFAIVQDDGALTAHRSMLCGDFPSFEAAMQSYAALQEIAITAASVAVAGPDHIGHGASPWPAPFRVILSR